MPRTSLTDHQQWTIINALYTAADQYSGDATRTKFYAPPSVTEQFQTQAREARELAAIIEQAQHIELSFEGKAP